MRTSLHKGNLFDEKMYFWMITIQEKKMRIAVTGASGHIGYNLVRRLLSEGHEITVWVHREDVFSDLPVRSFRGDLREGEDVRRFVKGQEAVYHLAANIFISVGGRRRFFRDNLRMSQNVLRATKAEGCRYLYFSSVHAYDPFPLDEPLDERRALALHDRSLYARSKALAQQQLYKAAQEGVDVVILNPTAVIGPYDRKPSYLGRAILMMAKGRLPALIPGGYDWVDVRDVAEGAVQALTRGRRGEAYILGGHWRSLKDLDALVRAIRGIRRRPPMLPWWLAYIGAPFLAIAARLRNEPPLYTFESLTHLRKANTLVSHEKASRELNYHPRPLEETLQDTLQWFQDNKMLD